MVPFCLPVYPLWSLCDFLFNPFDFFFGCYIILPLLFCHMFTKYHQPLKTKGCIRKQQVMLSLKSIFYVTKENALLFTWLTHSGVEQVMFRVFYLELSGSATFPLILLFTACNIDSLPGECILYVHCSFLSCILSTSQMKPGCKTCANCASDCYWNVHILIWWCRKWLKVFFLIIICW